MGDSWDKFGFRIYVHMIPLDMFKNIATMFMREICFAFQKIRRVAENLPVKKWQYYRDPNINQIGNILAR